MGLWATATKWDKIGLYAIEEAVDLKFKSIDPFDSSRASSYAGAVYEFNWKNRFYDYRRTLTEQQIFDIWLDFEKNDKKWQDKLPVPPACLVRRGDKYTFPVKFNLEWKQPELLNFFTKKYHPKGTWEIRTQKANAYGAGNQAIYDDKGWILTGGYSAGSADRRQADSIGMTLLKFGQGGHIKEDVEPYDLAKRLDSGRGANVQKYLSVRPTIVPKEAKPNVLDPF